MPTPVDRQVLLKRKRNNRNLPLSRFFISVFIDLNFFELRNGVDDVMGVVVFQVVKEDRDVFEQSVAQVAAVMEWRSVVASDVIMIFHLDVSEKL